MPTTISIPFEAERQVYLHFSWPLFPLLVGAVSLILAVQSPGFQEIMDTVSLVPAP